MNDSYKTFQVSLRPPRVACLIDLNDGKWQSKVLIAIESFSRTWGGAGFIIVPTDGKTISPVFWEILSSYDPDYLWIAYLTNDRHEQPLILADELLRQLKLRLAPFHHDDKFLTEQHRQVGHSQNLIIKGGTYPDFEAAYPFTDTITILPNCEHSNRVAEITTTGDLMKIWAASTTGLVSSTYKNQLQDIEVEVQKVDSDANTLELFKTVVGGIHRTLAMDDYAFPFAFAQSHLGSYRSNEFHDWKEAILVIVGETLEDFCLYFCLSRMRYKAAWLLTSWLPNDTDPKPHSKLYEDIPIGYFAKSLRDLKWESRGESATHFMSASLPVENLDNVRNLFSQWDFLEVGDGLLFDENQSEIEKTDSNLSESIKFLLRYPMMLFEIGNAYKTVSRHFIGSDMAGFFEPPKPKKFSKIDKDHHWVSDFSIADYNFPRHPELGEKIVKDSLINHHNARVGKTSVAFVDAKSGYINSDIDSWLRKPRIHLPEALEIFQTLFLRNGYKSDISDKGRYASRTISKFGGLQASANFLIGNGGKLFDRYISKKDDSPDEGLLLSDKRHYLSFETFKTILGNEKTASEIIFAFLSASIIHRGLVLKCQDCRNADWFSVAEITNEFQCKRCNLKQIYLQSHCLNQLEPKWYYKLDEIVYQAIVHNSKVPILAINYLREQAEVFDYCPEIALSDSLTGKATMEIDICCIQDGKLTIGEAKVSERLALTNKEENLIINKYFELSEKIGASQVVFATSSDNWLPATQARILGKFSTSLTKVLFLTQKKLRSGTN